MKQKKNLAQNMVSMVIVPFTGFCIKNVQIVYVKEIRLSLPLFPPSFVCVTVQEAQGGLSYVYLGLYIYGAVQSSKK